MAVTGIYPGIIMKGHTNFVNSITFDPSNGSQLASTGDDLTCRIWDKEGDERMIFQLTSPGMSVCWHQEEPFKILVAQKNGIIRMFSLHNQQSIMSLNTGQVPLMSADWSRHDSLIVGAAASIDWLVFNTSLSSQPVEKRQAHTDGVRQFRWSRCHESLLATTGRPGRQIKVFNTRHPQLHVNTSLPIAYGLSWHLHLPILAIGGDKNIHLWVVEST
ncbi:nucleoporin Nup37-like [Gigantopelta aegis]|uniref:nucleoporin Nup37-like n=1 Tax=Gigantopelta aegis TaxID=1735272 RepID=UPI001B88C3D9|nr:nucleoporin Nup37-like [Gigantopelta aegis]